MKIAFYFMLKALFVFEIFTFLPRHFGYVGKRPDKKIFMTSQTGQQMITIHMLPSISRSKGNQTMKFGKIMGYDIRNIFLEKSYAKCVGES